jgi:PAS domain S-box-containing protein
MQSATKNDREHFPPQVTAPVWKLSSTLVVCSSFLLAPISLTFRQIEFSGVLLILALVALCSVVVLHARFLYLARNQYRQTSSALETREIEFHSVFENVLDAILILDGRATCREANPSALQLFGISREQMIDQPIATFYSDRDGFNSAWKRLLAQKHDRGESEIMRPDGQRVFVEFTATADFLPDRHLISLRDVTQRHHAEEDREKSLALARSAWREADALREATLALTQDLRMNSVLETLLAVLHRQIPYERAQVLLLEAGSRFFLAQETTAGGDTGQVGAYPDTLDASDHPIVQRALVNSGGVLIQDTFEESDWKDIVPGTTVRSWLGIPLYSSDGLLGILCVAHTRPGQFTAEHLRIARSLAISASVAIQNARLYERAEIYASELNRRPSNLR